MAGKTELLDCPWEFQQRVTEAGGLNRYDAPNFKIAWSQSEFTRAGGIWTPPGEPTFKGYRDIPLGLEPCWVLMEWHAPEEYGTPESYYVENYDAESGLQTLGGFPYSGRYEIAIPLFWRGEVNGKPVVEHMPLSALLVDLVIPIIQNAKGITAAQRKLAFLQKKEQQDKEQLRDIEASLSSAHPQFISRSAAALECNSVVQKRMEAIEQHWKQASTLLRSRGRGLSQGSLN